MKKLKFFIIGFLFLLLFVGCGSDDNVVDDGNYDGDQVEYGSSSENRIIIYKARLQLTVDDLDKTYETIK